MEDHKESNGWVSVPAFGEWENRNRLQYFSREFSLVREARQQDKATFTPANVDNGSDLRGDQQRRHRSRQRDRRGQRDRRFQWIRPRNRFSCTTMAKIMSNFIKPKITRCFCGRA